MNWKIEYSESTNSLLTFVSDFAELDDFMNSIDTHRWITFIDISIKEEAIHLQYRGLTYANYLDNFDVEAGIFIPNGSIRINLYVSHDCQGEILVKKKDFEEALLAYSERLLEIHQNNKDLPEKWAKEMKEGIEKLKNKIDGYSAC